MIHAAINGHLPEVEYLLEKGADPNAEDNVNEQLTIDLLFLTPACYCSGDRMHYTLFAMVSFN